MRIVSPCLSGRLVLALLLAACGGAGGPTVIDPPGGIGPEGGTIMSPDGRATLVIPPDALSAPTDVAVANAPGGPLDPSLVGQSAYRITPTTVQFSAPATLMIHYDPALGPIGIAEADLRGHELANGAWSPVGGGSIDANAHVARIAVSAAGSYGVRWTGLEGPCDAPEHRQFDFWLGEWDFVVPGGPPQRPTNTITADPDGCAIDENFVTPTGVNGRSVSFYNPANQQWHQTYIDDMGTRLRMSGKLEGGTMLLYTDASSRFGWTPGTDEVRYYGETSPDGGVTWTVTFDSKYVAR